jgi:integrase
VLVQAKERCRAGHFWVLIAPRRHVLYRYSARHDANAVDAMLAGYKGYLVADAHAVYDHLYRGGDVIEVGCWAHARRYFFKALDSEPEGARQALALIGELFRIERQIAEEKKAQAFLNEVEAGIRATLEHRGDGETGPLTFQRFATNWIKERRDRGLTCAGEDEGRMKHHVLAVFGHRRLDDIRPRDIRQFVREMQAENKLAPRTIRNIYGMLHTLFRDAVVEELIQTNPCIVKHGELPEKIDKEPTWRSTAVFMRDEVEQLISDERIPEDRRVAYTILFLAGLREGEMAALRWEHYDAESEPLGRLLVAYSYSTRLRAVKRVKTKIPRDVPVHPTLATVSADWRENGWARMMGRAPTVDDLIVPEPPYEGKGEVYRRMLRDEPGLKQADLARRLGVSRATITQAFARDAGLGRNGRPQSHGPHRTATTVYKALQKTWRSSKCAAAVPTTPGAR